jgi:diguanylate cyclase (GGDEF)-like protein
VPQPETRQANTAAALAAVRRLSFATLDAPDPEAIHRTLAGELLQVFAIDRVHVSLPVPGARSAKSAVYAHGPDGPRVEERFEARFGAASGLSRVIELNSPLNVPDAPSSPYVDQALVKRFNAASALFVPVTYESAVHAVVVLVSHARRRFAPQEIELAYTMANQAAAGLAVLEMRERLGRRAERNAALVGAARALGARLDLRGVLDVLCEQANLALGADIAGVYLGDWRDGGLAFAAHGLPPDSDWWGSHLAPGEGVAGRVLQTGEPVVSNSYRADVGQPRTTAMVDVETAVSVPVCWSGELKGALSVAFVTPRPIADDDIATLQAIADLAAVACSNAQAYEEAQEAARTDSLTGLLNHGAIQVRVREEIWRARRSGNDLSCLLVDLDNFKPINDRHGHRLGDEILKSVATAVATEFRPYDGIGRYGGDEFVLILPGTGEDAALEAAERLRAVVEETGVRFGDLGVHVTCSIGVAHWREPLTAAELLERADRALLLAKRRGKDGVVFSNIQTERDLAELELEARPSRLMTRFWDVVSRSVGPRDVLSVLPSFLCRELELEEVTLLELSSAVPGRALTLLATARQAGDPAPAVLKNAVVTFSEDLARKLGGGPIARESLSELWSALSLDGRAGAAPIDDSAGGSYAAIGLVERHNLHALLLMRHQATHFPGAAARLAEVVAGQAVTVLLGQSGGGSRTAVAALAAAIDARDNYTMAHSEEVVALACEVARRLALPPGEIAKVRDGAMLHDVGKVAIPNEILYKPGPLTMEEWEVMRRHPVIGERILRRTPELEPIAPLVRHEHERWDGTGYPDGLAGEQIPVGSRIILACDAYNAMITARPYRDPMSPGEAIAELENGAGSQFDPRVVSALVQLLAVRELGSAA